MPLKRISRLNNNNKTLQLINEIIKSKIDITKEYNDWLKIAFAFAEEFEEGGRDYFHRVSQFYPGYNPSEADKQYAYCLKHKGNGVSIATFYYLCSQTGGKIMDHNSYHH